MKGKELLLPIAKEFMMVFLKENPNSTASKFDEIIGGLDVAGTLSLSRPRWNESIFFNALIELINEEKVSAVLYEDGWYYNLEENKP